MGVDTVKLVYDAGAMGPKVLDRAAGTWTRTTWGTQGPVWWVRRKHEDGTALTLKGSGAQTYAIWEGSVPKFLGMPSVAQAGEVRLVDGHIRRLVPGLPCPRVRRVDVTEDVYDPEGLWRVAALGWKPHARSRYVQAVYEDGETVWQHNKTRGVRIYDKYAECGLEWSRGMTRVEYQIRGPWCEKLCVDELGAGFELACGDALRPVVEGLRERVGGLL